FPFFVSFDFLLIIAFRLTFPRLLQPQQASLTFLLSFLGEIRSPPEDYRENCGKQFGNVLHDFTSLRFQARMKNLKPRFIIPDPVMEAISRRKCSLCTLIPLLTEVCTRAAS